MKPQEKAQLAIDISDGKVFGTWDRRLNDQPSLVGSVFMPVAFGMFGTPEMQAIREDIAHLYEYFDKAGPRSINGCPIFYSAHFILKPDWEIVLARVTELEEFKKKMTSQPLFD